MESTPQHMPGKRAIIPYYVMAALCFVIANVLTVLSASEFKEHFFQPHILAIVHLIVLGWGTMIIFGASNQLVPVIADNDLYSDDLALFAFVMFSAGLGIFVYSFWGFAPGVWMFIAAFLMLISFVCHAVNIFLTSKKTLGHNIITTYVLTAHAWLIGTASIGILLLFNLRWKFLPAENLHYLKAHASIGMLGWFLLLIIGVSARLFPMFLLSRNEPKKYLTIAFGLINAGLLLLLVEGLGLTTYRAYFIYIAMIVSGIVFYLVYMRYCYVSAMKRVLDIAMKQSFIAVFSIVLPFVLLIFAVLIHGVSASVIIAYGYSFLGGFVTTIIMGQTFKTLPFIIWMHITKQDELPVIFPKDLYKKSLVLAQLVLYLPGFLLFLSGILFKLNALLYTGAVIMLLAAIVYFGHVIYVVSKLRMR